MRGTLRKEKEVTTKVGFGHTMSSINSPRRCEAKEVSPKVGNTDNELFMKSKKIKVDEETMRAYMAETLQRKKAPKPFHE